MNRYLLSRVASSLFSIWAASLLIFVLLHLTGDPAVLLSSSDASPQDVAFLRHQLGFDRPIHEQYFAFISRLAHGDFGESLRHREPAFDLVLARIPATVALALSAMAVALVVAIPLGVLAAVKRNTIYDRLALAVALVGNSVPTFWLGILLILTVSVGLGWLPSSGGGGFRYIVLPALTLGSFLAGEIMRMLRSSLIDSIGQDYVRTARSKGLREQLIFRRHIAKNAAFPVVTLIGLQLSGLVAGAVATETVFGYPGMGLLAIQAILGRDFPVVMAFVWVVAVVVVVASLAVDLIYLYLDPRVRYA